MAPITPYQQGVVGAFQTQSKEFSGIRGYSPMGKLFEGVGDALSIGVRGWDELQEIETKNKQSDDIRGTVERDTQAGIDLLGPTGGRTAVSTGGGYPSSGPEQTSPTPFRMPPSMAPGEPVPYTTAPSVSTTGQAPIPQALGYAPEESPIIPTAGVPQDVTSPAAIAGPEPVEVTRGMERLDKLGRAIRLTHNIGLYADVLQQTKDLIAKYPNRRTQIIEQSKSILGTDAGMGLRNAVLQLLTIQANEANSNEKAWQSWMNSHTKYFMRPDGTLNEDAYRKALTAGNDPVAQNEYKTYIAKQQVFEHASDVAKKEFDRKLAEGKADGLSLATGEYSRIQSSIMNGITFSMGNESFNYQTMLQTANALLLSGKPADREKLVQLAAVHKQFVDMFDRAADRMETEAIHGPEKKSIRQLTDPADLKKSREQARAVFDNVTHHFGKDNAVLATNLMNTKAGIEDTLFMKGIANPVFQGLTALRVTAGGEAAAVLANRFLQAEGFSRFNDAAKHLTTISSIEMPQNTGNLSMQEYMRRYGVILPSNVVTQDTQEQQQKVDFINMHIDLAKAGISAKNIPDVNMRAKYAAVITHPDTGKWITDFKKDQQHIVWGRLADPEVSANMKEIGGQTWVNYRNWNTETLKQLYDTNIGELASAAKDPRLNLRLSEDGTQLIYDNIQPSPLDQPRTLSQLGRYTTAVPQTKDIQAVERFNTGLKIYNNVISQDGDTLTPQMLKTLGLPLKEVQGEEGSKPMYMVEPERDPNLPTPVQTVSFKKPGANPPPDWLADVSPEQIVPGGIQQAPGMAPAQQAIEQAIQPSGRYSGPRSPAIQAAVDTVVKGTGRSAAFIAAMASIESDMGWKQDKKDATYRGLFQQGGPNIREGENADDPMSNAAITVRTTNQNIQILRNALGREPEDHEVYLAHQQGPAGGPALLRGAEEGLTAVESLRKYANLSPIRAIEHLRNNRRNDIRDVPIQNLTAAAFVESWRNAVEERKRAFGGGRQSALPFADEGRVVSDVTDPILVGEQYAMGLGGRNIYEAGARPGRPSGEGGGGGVAPSRGQQVGGNVREGLEVIEGEQHVPAPPITRGRPSVGGVTAKRPTDESPSRSGDEVFEVGGQIVRRRSIPTDVNQSVNAAMRAIREGQVEETVAQTGAELRGDIATRRAREAADLDAAITRRMDADDRLRERYLIPDADLTPDQRSMRTELQRLEAANRRDAEAAGMQLTPAQRLRETTQRRLESEAADRAPTPRQQRARELDSQAWERVFGDQYTGQRVSESDRRRANREQMRRVREEDEQLSGMWERDALFQRPFTEEDFAGTAARSSTEEYNLGAAASSLSSNQQGLLREALRGANIPEGTKRALVEDPKDIRVNPETSKFTKLEKSFNYLRGDEVTFIPKEGPQKGKEVIWNINYDPQTGNMYVYGINEAGKMISESTTQWSLDAASGFEFLRALRSVYPGLNRIEGGRITGAQKGHQQVIDVDYFIGPSSTPAPALFLDQGRNYWRN